MKKEIIYSLVFLVITLQNCCNISDKENYVNKKYIECLRKWNIEIEENQVLIKNEDEIKVSFKNDSLLFDSLIFDTLNLSIFIVHGHKLLLINCNEDRLYQYQIKDTLISVLSPTIDRHGGYYIYSERNGFYLFDNKLRLVYNSWNFIKNLSDKDLLGLSGVHVTYKIEKNDKIKIVYELLTDVDPFYKDTICDTLYIPQLGVE